MTESKMVGWHHRLNGHEFNSLREMVKDREAWCAAVHEVAENSKTLKKQIKDNTNRRRARPCSCSCCSLAQSCPLFVTLWNGACQASLSITNTWSLLKLMSIVSVMPSNHLILCHPLLLLPSIFPSIRVFSNESILCTRWPKY